jgi:ATP-dependent Clp protease ATP-binding subunit ClpB
MDINKLTQKSQDALQSAQTYSVELQHQDVDVDHLLYALLKQENGLIPEIFKNLNVNIKNLTDDVQAELYKRPSVSGSGVDPNKIYISPRLNLLLSSAEKEAKKLGDEYVSVEHIVL